MTRLYLIRHGETAYNARAKIQGSIDIPLSPKGKEQARLVSKRFKDIRLDLVYSSELLRAQQTAAEIAHIVRRPVIIDPRLNEMHFGIFEGLTFEEIAKKYPDMWEQREKNKLKYTGHKGESLIEFRDRVMGSLERIFYQFPDGDIAVVSHGGTNRVIMCALLGLDMKGFHLLRQDNTCINVLDIKVGKKKHIPCVWSINDISHLDTRFPKKKNVWH